MRIPDCLSLREDQARLIAAAVREVMRLAASGAPHAQLLAILLALRVPGERAMLALNPDFAAELADQLPRWAVDAQGAVVAGQAITLFLQPMDPARTP